MAIVKSPSFIVSCFKSNAVLICADVDGLVLFEEGALKVKLSCFKSNAVNLKM